MNKPTDYASDKRVVPYSNVKEHWHLSKGVNVSVILSIIIISGSGLSYVDTIADNVDKVSIEINHVKEKQEIQNDNISKEIKELKEDTQKQYENLDRKLDRLIDRELSANGN